jgi:hypothetical protein
MKRGGPVKDFAKYQEHQKGNSGLLGPAGADIYLENMAAPAPGDYYRHHDQEAEDDQAVQPSEKDLNKPRLTGMSYRGFLGFHVILKGKLHFLYDNE